jgi:hypothetical protein
VQYAKAFKLFRYDVLFLAATLGMGKQILMPSMAVKFRNQTKMPAWRFYYILSTRPRISRTGVLAFRSRWR